MFLHWYQRPTVALDPDVAEEVLVDPNVIWEIVPAATQLRRPKLCNNLGYTYAGSSEQKGGTYWRCSIRRANMYCKAKVFQPTGTQTFITNDQEHCHDPVVRSVTTLTVCTCSTQFGDSFSCYNGYKLAHKSKHACASIGFIVGVTILSWYLLHLILVVSLLYSHDTCHGICGSLYMYILYFRYTILKAWLYHAMLMYSKRGQWVLLFRVFFFFLGGGRGNWGRGATGFEPMTNKSEAKFLTVGPNTTLWNLLET